MKQLGLSTAAAPLLAAAMPASEAGAAVRADGRSRPNVLLMICDDLGYGDLGCYGSSLPTPHVDRLAAQGMRCMRYNSAHPICSASRAALLTGRYAPRSHTAGAYFPHSPVGMDTREQTLADLFRAQGYRTHAVGKWHLGDAPEYLPTARGFESFFGVPYSDDMSPLPLMRGTEVLEADTDRVELTPRYTKEALRVLQESGESPFFLYVAYSYPHDPARASKAFAGRTGMGDYGDAVAEIDWSVGQLMNELDRSGRSRDTVVIFTSDHGPWFQGSHGKTRGRKGSCFEGGVRVPFVVRWPGHVPAGQVCTEWLSSLNVLPTLSAWCGLAATRLPVDGVDMSGALLERGAAEPRTLVYFNYSGGSAVVHCVRKGAWKLRVAQCDGEIYTNDHTMGRNNYWLAYPELYDLERDPCESYDCAKQHPEVVRTLLAELERELASFPEDAQANFARLKTQVCSVVTPPGAAPRLLTAEQIAKGNWSYEPPERDPRVAERSPVSR